MQLLSGAISREKSPPVGLKWRSSPWMTTFVIGLGIAVDLIVYSIIIPVIPFQLEHLGYDNVSSLSGWLLFSYSAGLVVSTIPIALLSERYAARKKPLIFGLVLLLGSQIMLMEAPNYPVMCAARILQGFGSSMVWVVGLALLCDCCPASNIALYLGCAMSGLSLGVLIGPSVGGALYGRFGFRGPFIFAISATVIDLLGRLILVERKDAIRWGVDPAAEPKEAENTSAVKNEQSRGDQNSDVEDKRGAYDAEKVSGLKANDSSNITGSTDSHSPNPKKHLSLINVIVLLGKSPRTLVTCFILLVYGLVYSSEEPSIPVHLQRVWGLDSKAVGLVFIAASVPAFFSSPLSGYLTEKYGAEWTTVGCALLALPWWVVTIIEGRLALFVIAFAVQSFFTSAIIAPLTVELAAFSKKTDGVGYGHVYGALNLVFGIGSCIGPIIGGQIFDHLERGWMVICLISTGLLAVSLVLASWYTGDYPILRRLFRQPSPISQK